MVVGILMFGDGVKDEITGNILELAGYPEASKVAMAVFIAIIPLTKTPLKYVDLAVVLALPSLTATQCPPNHHNLRLRPRRRHPRNRRPRERRRDVRLLQGHCAYRNPRSHQRCIRRHRHHLPLIRQDHGIHGLYALLCHLRDHAADVLSQDFRCGGGKDGTGDFLAHYRQLLHHGVARDGVFVYTQRGPRPRGLSRVGCMDGLSRF